MFVAPLLAPLVPVAVVLWPIVLLVLGVAYLLLWPFAAISSWLGGRWLPARLATVQRWFVFMLRPWQYFDPPKRSRSPGTTPTTPTVPSGSLSRIASDTTTRDTTAESGEGTPMAGSPK
jgi:hypothetical protein